MPSSRLLAFGAVLATVTSACSGGSEPTPPIEGPGYVDLQVQVPPGRTDGGVLIRLSGAEVRGVLSSGLDVRSVGIPGTTSHLLVRGTLRETLTVASVCVPDVSLLSGYQRQVVRAAGGADEGYVVRGDISEYQVEFTNRRKASC